METPLFEFEAPVPISFLWLDHWHFTHRRGGWHLIPRASSEVTKIDQKSSEVHENLIHQKSMKMMKWKSMSGIVRPFRQKSMKI